MEAITGAARLVPGDLRGIVTAGISLRRWRSASWPKRAKARHYRRNRSRAACGPWPQRGWQRTAVRCAACGVSLRAGTVPL